MLTLAALLSLVAAVFAYDCKAPVDIAKTKWNGYEYLVSNTYLTFTECSWYCKDKDMQLASIHSAPEAAAVNSFCTDATAAEHCFLGMECVDDIDCTWTDGTPVDWTPYSNTKVKTFFNCTASGKRYNLAGYYEHPCGDYLPCMCKSVATPSCGTQAVSLDDLPTTVEACMDSDYCEKKTCGMDFSVHVPMCIIDKEEGGKMALENGSCCKKSGVCCDMDFKANGVVKLSGGSDSAIYQWKVQAKDKYHNLSKMTDCVVKVGDTSGCPGCD